MLEMDRGVKAPEKKTWLNRWKKILFIKWTKFLKRTAIYFDTKVNTDYIPSEAQTIAIRIFEKALLKPESELLMAPISHTFYIELEDIFIILEGREMLIINGRYQYNILIKERDAQHLIEKFKRVLEVRRKRMEKKVMSKTSRSLNDILNHLSSSPGESEE